VQAAWTAASLWSSEWALGDGSHRTSDGFDFVLGAAAALLLGLLGKERKELGWERKVAWWCGCLVEAWHHRLIFELLGEEVPIRDVGGRNVVVGT